MPTEVHEYVNVGQRALELGCNVPTSIALLPRNFDTVESKNELVHESSVPTVRALWRQADVAETRIEKGEDKFPYIQENSFEWVGPAIFVSASLWSQDPNAVSIAIGVISNYLTDLFKGLTGPQKVRLNVVVEQSEKSSSKQIHYEGDVAGLQELPKTINELMDSD